MRTTFLVAALLWASSALAGSTGSDSPRLDVAGPATSSTPSGGATTDEDEDEAPKGTTPAGTPPAGGEKKDVKAGAPTATPLTTTPAPAPTAETQKLVSGAPLSNPNVNVHIVEQKAFSDSGKREVVVFPLAAQVNGKFTQHLGTMAQFVWHLQENFGLQITGGGNWFNSESAFNAELVDKVREEAQAASSLLWTWGVMGGVEVTPLYGKFAFFEGTLAHFSIVLNGGAGAGSTRHQLKPVTANQAGDIIPASYGDTGVRFMGGLGAGFRLQLGSRFALRLEVRDVVYTARVDKVNGCDVADLRALDAVIIRNQDPSSVPPGSLSAGCHVETFSGVDPQTNRKRSDDVGLALSLVKVPTSDVLNNVGLYLGASFLF